jgi:hypothetical protein
MPTLTELETYYGTLVAETDEAREALDAALIAYSAASALSAVALVSLEPRRHTSGNPSTPPVTKGSFGSITATLTQAPSAFSRLK